MERIDRKLRTVYGKDLHDSHTSVTVRLETDELEHGDKIEVVTRKISKDEQATTDETDNDGDGQETTADN